MTQRIDIDRCEVVHPHNFRQQVYSLRSLRRRSFFSLRSRTVWGVNRQWRQRWRLIISAHVELIKSVYAAHPEVVLSPRFSYLNAPKTIIFQQHRCRSLSTHWTELQCMHVGLFLHCSNEQAVVQGTANPAPCCHLANDTDLLTPVVWAMGGDNKKLRPVYLNWPKM